MEDGYRLEMTVADSGQKAIIVLPRDVRRRDILKLIKYLKFVFAVSGLKGKDES